MKKSDLDTPCLILDADMLEANIAKMQQEVTARGKQLRPHAKTHKCSALALRQLQAGALGVCAAKVSEAEALVEKGVTGVLVTGPFATPRKAERLAACVGRSPSLMCAVDSTLGVELLSAALRAKGLTMDVLIDLDVGLHRTGARHETALGLAESALAHPNLRLRGIQAYAGQLQHIKSWEERKRESLAALSTAAEIFRALRKRIPACDIFSASGTGTFDIDPGIGELTELQAGSYACMDTEYRDLGSASDPREFATFLPALRVLSTVVSANQSGFVTIDAGLKALYRDGGTPRVYSMGAADPSAWTYDWFGDEYGKLTPAGRKAPAAGSGAPVSRASGEPLLPLGTVVELLPSHCDPTINLFDQFYVCRGDIIEEVWPIDLRGCSQ